MRPLILASTSRFRRSLLDRMEIPYEAIAPAFEELERPGETPLECARRFALGKAQAVAQGRPDAVVIGADQALDFGGRMLRKPETLEEATEQLWSLSGRWHALHSAIALVGPEAKVQIEVATTELKVRTLSRDDARRYVERDQPLGSVGGYVYEVRGFLLFDEVKGSDDSAIVGMPLWLLARMLRAAGFTGGVGGSEPG